MIITSIFQFVWNLLLAECICFNIDRVCNICMAAGGIGTVCTFFCMIHDSRKKAKQIDSVQKIQSLQLESLFQPNIRLVAWTYISTPDIQNEIVIENYGEDLLVNGIREESGLNLLNATGMTGWFPYNFDKGQRLHIPISAQLKNTKGNHDIGVYCSNKLGLAYMVSIHIEDGKPIILPPIKQ